MKLPYCFIVLGLLTATCATAPAPAKVPDPMKSFERLIAGEWKVTFASGVTDHSSWQWGPGQYSVRQHGLELMYWHPGRKQVRMLSLHPDIPAVGRGVGEGTIRFDGQTAEGTLDLDQPRGRRKLGIRWQFDGPDKYRDTLLEDTGGPEGMQPQNGWVRYRVPTRPQTASAVPATKAKLPEPMKVFEALLGCTWEAKDTHSTFEWFPEYVYARVVAPSKNGEPAHLLDAYFFQDVRTDRLRCLALSQQGAVYEGVIKVIEGDALQFDLKGYEEERIVALLVRLDLEKDGTLRQRIWSIEGTERKLMSDVQHRRR